MVSNAPSASIEHHSTPSEAESSRGYLGDGRDAFINTSHNITAQTTTAMVRVMRPMVPSSSHDLSRQPSASHGPEVLSSVAIAAGLVSSADYVNQGDSVTGPRAFATHQPITAAEILDNWVNATGISPEERADRETVKERILAANPTHGLHVNGDLDLSFCRNLTGLPEGLSVGGYLNLTDCTGLTSLPADILTWGALPDGSTRHIYLDETGISQEIITRIQNANPPGMQFHFSIIKPMITYESLHKRDLTQVELENILNKDNTCPISFAVPTKPVCVPRANGKNYIYEFESIKKWYDQNPTNPMTREPLDPKTWFVPNNFEQAEKNATQIAN